jgi:hypothetical protein
LGILKHLLFWPITGPTFLARFSLEKVEDTVREQLTDDQVIKEELLALQMRLELGEIDDEEYVRREAELMQDLRDIRHWREQLGMGMSGGPVRVARSEPSDEALPNLAENVVAAPEGTDARAEDPPQRGGIASPKGASVEIDLGWEE